MTTTHETADAKPGGVPKIARILVYAGMVPFIGGFLISLFGAPANLTLEVAMLAFKAYAAVILSFLGGVHWGMALTVTDPSEQQRSLIISVVPAIIGVVAVLLSAGPAFAVLAIAFLAQGIFDVFVFRKLRKGGWYARLRLEVTAIVVVLLALSAWFAG